MDNNQLIAGLDHYRFPCDYAYADTKYVAGYYCGNRSHKNCSGLLVEIGTRVNILGKSQSEGYVLTHLPNTCQCYIFLLSSLNLPHPLKLLAEVLDGPDA